MSNQPRLTQLSIRGFRGLKAIELTELGTFNVLLGANDVGKTSVLEALLLLAELQNPRLCAAIQQRRNYNTTSDSDLLLLFHGLDETASIRLQARGTGPIASRTIEISLSEPKFRYSPHDTTPDTCPENVRQSPRSSWRSSTVQSPRHQLVYNATVEYADGASDIIFSTTDVAEESRRASKPLHPNRSAVRISARLVDTGPGLDVEQLSQTIVSKRDPDLLQVLRYINPRIDRLSTTERYAYADIGLRRMIPLNMFGSGTLRVANILSMAMLDDVRLLMVEEIENGLHYKSTKHVLRALLTLCRNFGKQVFVTTYSIELLQYLREVLLETEFEGMQEDAMSYVLQLNPDTNVKAYPYDFPQFKHCVAHGLEVR